MDSKDIEPGDRVIYMNGRIRRPGIVLSFSSLSLAIVKVRVDAGYTIVTNCSFIDKATSQLLLERAAAEATYGEH